MFEELFPSKGPARYQDDAVAAGFHFVDGDIASDPDAAGLVSVHGAIYNCAVGTCKGRRVAVFESDLDLGDERGSKLVAMTIAYDIGNCDFREARGMDSYWNIRREENWVYFEASGQEDRLPPFPKFFRETSEILELYLI